MSFVHLHVHTEYSLLDGLSKIDDLIDRAKKQKMDALAITDHGVMHGAIKFYTAAKDAGVKPIIGVEAYQARRSRFDKQAGIDKDQFHVLLLAKNITGYKNLMKMTSIAHLEGYYYKPRIDKDVLEQHREGVIACSGCLQGEVPQLILQNDINEAKKVVDWWQRIFGNDYYLEIQGHSNIPEQDIVNQQLVKFSREMGVPLVATNDVHYVHKDDAEAQDALLAVQTKKFLADKDRLTMLDSPDFYLKSGREMEEMFSQYPDAIENTIKISQKCNLEIPIGKWILPEYPLKKNETPESALRDMTMKRLKKRFKKISPDLKSRIDYELEIICGKGFATYFLIVQDFTNWAKKEGIRVGPGRGSVAGSLVSYVLRITSINPLEHNIPFERFMNPDRPTPPDIDLDFADERRDEVIEYVTKKYGKDRVAQIITFGTMEARQAIRDIGRVMGLPYSVPDKIAKMIPPGHSIEEAMNSSFELQEEAVDLQINKMLSLAKRVEGVSRHASTHAAGVVIADRDLTEYTPIQRETKADRIITQYDMYSLDLNVSDKAIGLLKIDFLGLRNLTILGRAIDLVKETKNIKVDISEIPLDEKGVFEMIGSGETTGVFQLESKGMRRLARNLKPTKFSDITAMVALFRPGPMELIDDFVKGKRNPKRVKYLHPDLEEILAPTYGVAVYQEQCMQIANKVAGFTMAEADSLRRAIGKKKKAIMNREKRKFVEGAIKNGYVKNAAEKIWGFIEKFVGYGFNIPHAVSYAMISYQTAYMKLKFPDEYMAALLTSESRSTSGPIRDQKVARGIEECRRLGINILIPDINKSGKNFTLENDRESGDRMAIRFGLSAIKNVGEAAIGSILSARKKGPFLSVIDFLMRTDGQKVNKKIVESLVKVGALDCFGSTRTSILAALDEMRNRAMDHQKRASDGQTSMFSRVKQTGDSLPELQEFSRDKLLRIEKELLGIYLTEHPLQKYLIKVKDKITDKIGDLTVEDNENQIVVVAGVCSQTRTIQTRKTNEMMCFATVEDDTASIDLVVFPELFKKYFALLSADKPLLIQARVDFRNDRLGLVAEKLMNLEGEIDIRELLNFRAGEKKEGKIVEIPRGTPKEILGKVAKLLKSNPGRDRVQILLPNGNGTVKKMELPYRVDWSAVEKEIADLLHS